MMELPLWMVVWKRAVGQCKGIDDADLYDGYEIGIGWMC